MRIDLTEFAIGQRYISSLEAGLGLGMVCGYEGRRVSIYFPATDEERHYAIDQAALTRIVYTAGDHIEDLNGNSLLITNLTINDGLYLYEVENQALEKSVIAETELSHNIQFSQPSQRLLNGLSDAPKAFQLRQIAQQLFKQWQSSEAQGLLGPRVQLLAHQLYIADRVAHRASPRVLLADEVGLGKTIEAGLIIHQQLTLGFAQRILILVPDSLLHQWLVEMLRRFNLHFSVFDQDICEAAEASFANPFESQQLVLAPLSLVSQQDKRTEQILACTWDLVVIDEAHHLAWSEQSQSAEYSLVESLSAKTNGLLLLTATPEQAGIASHFARLKLLDANRYFDLDTFIDEETHYQQINQLLDQILEHDFSSMPEALKPVLTEAELSLIDSHIELQQDQQAKRLSVNALLDRHGTGRVLMRNTRHTVTGFPNRILQSYPLELPSSELIAGASLQAVCQIESLWGEEWLQQDLRVDWLLKQLHLLAQQKCLLICANASTAIALEEHLRIRHSINTAVFHEHMSLIQRDRAAAYFADPEEGAQILICSEIGSEGRNFQFAAHLILFDLPLNPDLLEQRIGRLDRIGQSQDVHIHIPYYQNTAQAILLRWYHEGINAIEQTCAFGFQLFSEFAESLNTCIEANNEAQINQLIQQTQQKAEYFRNTVEQQRNRLLELNSCRHDEAEQIIDHMLVTEQRAQLQSFIEQFCDQFGIEIEALNSHVWCIRQGDHQRSSLANVSEEGFSATFSRETALSRDDLQYLTWEHPFVQEALELILQGEYGNSNVVSIKLKGIPAGSLLLEASFSIDAPAPKYLQLNRYIQQSNIRCLMNLQGKDLSNLLSAEQLQQLVEKIPANAIQALIKQANKSIQTLISAAEHQAQQQLPALISAAHDAMQLDLDEETSRLQALQSINPNVSSDEIDALVRKKSESEDALKKMQLVTDSLRLVIAK